jgi:hypothetical protein
MADNSDKPTGWTTGIRFLAGEVTSLLHRVKTGSGAHSASYPKDTGGFFHVGTKFPGREADH